MKCWRGLVLLCGALLLSGCGDDDEGGISYDNIGDNNPDVIVCIGDSITGDSNYSGVAPYPSVLQAMKPDKTIINEGRGNDKSGSGAGRIGGVLDRHKPAAITILYGAVDLLHGGRYQTIANNIRSMIQQAKANQTVPVVMTMLPITRTDIWLQATKDVNVLIRQVAKEEGAELVDLEKEFSGSEETLLPDGLHPSAEGINIIAAALADVL